MANVDVKNALKSHSPGCILTEFCSASISVKNGQARYPLSSTSEWALLLLLPYLVLPLISVLASPIGRAPRGSEFCYPHRRSVQWVFTLFFPRTRAYFHGAPPPLMLWLCLSCLLGHCCCATFVQMTDEQVRTGDARSSQMCFFSLIDLSEK